MRKLRCETKLLLSFFLSVVLSSMKMVVVVATETF